jgi:hypothetical protein
MQRTSDGRLVVASQTKALFGAASVLAIALTAWFSCAVTNPPDPNGEAGLDSKTRATTGHSGPKTGSVSRHHVQAPHVSEPPQANEDGAFATKQEFLASHLKVAPRSLQESAIKLFELQAAQLQALVSEGSVNQMSDLLTEISNKFAIRQRQLAAAKAANGECLLVIDGHDYAKRVEGKFHLLLHGGDSFFGTTVAVLVVMDEGSDELTRIDREFRETRSIHLLDILQVFNNKPYEERLRVTDEFRVQQASGEAYDMTKTWFGVDQSYLRLLRIEASTRQVLPIEL